jgi:hypothetical protein
MRFKNLYKVIARKQKGPPLACDNMRIFVARFC